MTRAESLAFRAGAADARRLHRAFDRHRVVLASNNPYRRPETRAEWQRGFLSAYDRKGVAS